MSHFSEQLRQHLATVNISIYRLAKLCDTTEQHMYKVGRGERRASDEILIRIANAGIGLEALQLFDWRTVDDRARFQAWVEA